MEPSHRNAFESDHDSHPSLAARLRRFRFRVAPGEQRDRSWLLLAHDAGSDQPAGVVRVTPRGPGSLEAERHFPLPRSAARSAELSHLAWLPVYGTGDRVLPLVAVGLCAAAFRLIETDGLDFVLLRRAPEEASVFRYVGFQRTSMLASTDTPGAWQELLCADLRFGGRRLGCAPVMAALLARGLPPIDDGAPNADTRALHVWQ